MSELKLQQCLLDGRYEIRECLGRGSYAEIYIARDLAATEGAPQMVVIKALNVFLQGDSDEDLERTLVENFQKEAIALDRVRHPNIISRLGHGTAIDLAGTAFHYLVLEYLPGGDMAVLSRSHLLPIETVLYYLEQVCSGLAHAHSCGVIHRDIKPQNLLLTADRKVLKIADFGVAKLEASEGGITRVGTNVYAPPEHNPLVQTGPLDASGANEPSAQLTPAADIYSLAKTTYVLLTGESPRKFAHNPINGLPQHVADKPWASDVLRVLVRATQSAPLARQQTVQEFWDEFADAAMPPTKPLPSLDEAEKKERGELRPARQPERDAPPPRPRFQSSDELKHAAAYAPLPERPRIVVPVANPTAQAQIAERKSQHRPAREIIAAMPDVQKKSAQKNQKPPTPFPARRGSRLLFILMLFLAFSGVLLATYSYIRSHRTNASGQSQQTQNIVVGHTGKTISDVNLRPDPSMSNAPIGLAEGGSQVRIISVGGSNNNWYEVEILQHSREKADPDSLDRGWIHKRWINLDS
ncbi:MAG TPA: protein kinase [Pyrinomonadaceae bacterium]|nr:protein kinase [Pyrinomonadaceae bacterium]